MTEILLKAIAGLLLGGVCGYFVAIKAMPFIPRGDSKAPTVGFDLDAMARGFVVLSLGILAGAVIGLFTALWLAT